MTECTQTSFPFAKHGRRQETAPLDGGTISSDSGAVSIQSPSRDTEKRGVPFERTNRQQVAKIQQQLSAIILSLVALSFQAVALHGEILYTVSSRQSSETYAMKPDATNRRRVIAAAQGKRDWFPRWSSGGSKVVFFSDRNRRFGATGQRPHGEGDRFVVNSNGSSLGGFSPDSARFAEAQKTVNDKVLDPLEPDLSPSETQIVFSHGQRNDADEWRSDLFLIDADGSNLRKIPGTGQSYQARWSPDGSQHRF